MYTMYGLELIVQGKNEQVAIGYVRDALQHISEAMADIEMMTHELHETFGVEIEVDTEKFYAFIQKHHALIHCQSVADIALFTHVYDMAVTAYAKRREVIERFHGAFEQLAFQAIAPRYFVLEPNRFVFHKSAGVVNYQEELFITVRQESEDYYKGLGWDSHLMDVVFKKTDLRPLTTEEKQQFNIQ